MNDGNDSDQITIDLPSNIMAQIDAQVGVEFVDRADFIRAAVRHYLEYLQERARAIGQSG